MGDEPWRYQFVATEDTADVPTSSSSPADSVMTVAETQPAIMPKLKNRGAVAQIVTNAFKQWATLSIFHTYGGRCMHLRAIPYALRTLVNCYVPFVKACLFLNELLKLGHDQMVDELAPTLLRDVYVSKLFASDIYKPEYKRWLSFVVNIIISGNNAKDYKISNLLTKEINALHLLFVKLQSLCFETDHMNLLTLASSKLNLEPYETAKIVYLHEDLVIKAQYQHGVGKHLTVNVLKPCYGYSFCNIGDVFERNSLKIHMKQGSGTFTGELFSAPGSRGSPFISNCHQFMAEKVLYNFYVNSGILNDDCQYTGEKFLPLPAICAVQHRVIIVPDDFLYVNDLLHKFDIFADVLAQSSHAPREIYIDVRSWSSETVAYLVRQASRLSVERLGLVLNQNAIGTLRAISGCVTTPRKMFFALVLNDFDQTNDAIVAHEIHLLLERNPDLDLSLVAVGGNDIKPFSSLIKQEMGVVDDVFANAIRRAPGFEPLVENYILDYRKTKTTAVQSWDIFTKILRNLVPLRPILPKAVVQFGESIKLEALIPIPPEVVAHLEAIPDTSEGIIVSFPLDETLRGAFPEFCKSVAKGKIDPDYNYTMLCQMHMLADFFDAGVLRHQIENELVLRLVDSFPAEEERMAVAVLRFENVQKELEKL